MTIRFVCPSGHPLSADEHMAGTSLRCAACGEMAIVPPVEKTVEARALRDRGATAADASPSRATRSVTWRPRPLRRPRSPSPRERSACGGSRGRGRRCARRLAARLAAARRRQGHGLRPGGDRRLQPAARSQDGQPESGDRAGWATAALLLAVVQGFYIVWMLAAPDWSSVWVLMVVFAVSAAGYAAATPVAAFAPPERLAALGMPSETRFAAGWCPCVMLTLLLGTYLCGRLATRWRRAYQLEMAAKQRALRALK